MPSVPSESKGGEKEKTTKKRKKKRERRREGGRRGGRGFGRLLVWVRCELSQWGVLG